MIEDFASRNFWWALLVCVIAGIPFSIIGWIAKKINKYFGILVQCGLSIGLSFYIWSVQRDLFGYAFVWLIFTCLGIAGMVFLLITARKT